MGLSALEIYKHLPKTNCGKCNFPTCLAFAMQLAQKKANFDACPDVSDEVKVMLEESAAPPIKLVKIGAGENAVEIGNETELFRHEKTFYHPTALSAMFSDTMGREELEKNIEEVNALKFERVGQVMKLDLIAIKSESNDPAKFSEAVEIVQSRASIPLILMSNEPAVIEAGLEIVSDKRPLIHSATNENWDTFAKLAKEFNCPLTVKAGTLDELADLTQKVKGQGVEEIVLDFGKKGLSETLQNLTMIRRLAIKKTFRPLGYPVLLVLDGSPEEEAVMTSIGIMKYASAIVMKDISAWKLFPLFTLRQNIYTDPQKPIQVKPGIYEINSPKEDSPVLVTTNFSLTYFTVSGDIESSKLPGYLIVVDSEGLSVMTAFAADKFNADKVAQALEETNIKEKVNHQNVIIPGMVARMTAKLKEKSGWAVTVGPRESSVLPKFLKELAGA